MQKVTIAKAEIGQQFSIQRGRQVQRLGALVEKVRGPRGYNVRFEDNGELTYNGFAGGATVVLRHNESATTREP